MSIDRSITEPTRCAWVSIDPLYQSYHDTEWGIPLHDDQKLFEALILDTFQAGLSWITILRKREGFRKSFDDFDAVKIASYSEEKIQQLMADAGIVRNQLKIRAAITNAQLYLKTQQEFGTFDAYIWQFVNHKPIVNFWSSLKEYPTKTAESDAMSKDMKKRGFKFCGTTICYAFMQAVGMVNDHSVACFRHSK